MTEERNPDIQALFAKADQDLHDPAFSHDVMTGIDGMASRRLVLFVISGLASFPSLYLDKTGIGRHGV